MSVAPPVLILLYRAFEDDLLLALTLRLLATMSGEGT